MNARWVRGTVGALVLGMALLPLSVGAQVIINEIAWAGTAASANDEWIELHNTTEEAIDLTGWTLWIGDSAIHLGEAEDATVEVRSTMIDGGGYFLLERTDDTTVSDIEADLVYRGSLSNDGADVRLVDAAGETVDEALFAESGWPAGTASDEVLPYATMERIDPPIGTGAWATIPLIDAANGLDANGNPLHGTPRAENGIVLMMASIPRVQLIGPLEGPVSGTVVIEWSAVDPDGDDAALSVMILLTRVEPLAIDTLAENLANTGSFAWDTTRNVDGEYELTIMVEDADGHLGSAESGILTIEN